MTDALWGLVTIAVLVGAAWLGFMIEPHYVSKDGRRMIVNGQLITPQGASLGRWRETKIHVTPQGIVAEQKRAFRRRGSTFVLASESATPPRKKVVFLLRNVGEPGEVADPALLAIRLPAKSKGVPILRELLPS